MQSTRLSYWIAACVALSVAMAASGEILYVDHAAPGPTHDGSSWCEAFVYLEEALTEAEAPYSNVTEIRVADGVYTPHDLWPSKSFELVRNVTVLGGYAGCGAPDPDERNIQGHETILSGDLLGDDAPVACDEDSPDCDAYGGRCGEGNICFLPQNTDDNSWHVVVVNISGAVLDGFTITGGNAHLGGEPNNRAGGILPKSNAVLTVRNCRIVGNSASYAGGGVSPIGYADVTFIDCTLAGNHGGYYGGAVGVKDSSVTTMINCAVTNNIALDVGGGIFLQTGGTNVFTNTLVADNVASQVGGIAGSKLVLSNCTITGNEATGSASGGVFCGASTISNCILWGNLPRESIGSQLTIVGDTTVQYSDIEGGAGLVWDYGSADLNWGLGNITDAPNFVNPTQADYRLLSDSPCIDAASDLQVPLDTDDLDEDENTTERVPLGLGGVSRFVDDPLTPDTGVPDPPDYLEVVDMGAHEYDICRGQAIVESWPPSCAVDARQPSDPDGSNHAVLDWTLTMTGDLRYLASDEFSVSFGPYPTIHPHFYDVTVHDDAVTFAFDPLWYPTPVFTGDWMQFTHDCSETTTCIGWLPADVNGDLTSAPYDVLAVIDHLNGVTLRPHYSVDVDRDGTPAPADILRVIDLLNGTQTYRKWVNVSLPECPCNGRAGAGGGGAYPCDAGDDGEGDGEESFADGMVRMLTSDAWSDGLTPPDIRMTVMGLVDWCVTHMARPDRRDLAGRLLDPHMSFPNPTVAELIPEIIAALWQ